MTDDDPATTEVLGWRDLFTRSPEARLRMACARRAGIPYSEALRRWAHLDDIAAELAWDAIEAENHWARCPSCGTHPGDMIDDRGRPLKEPPWQVKGYTCLACEMVQGASDKLPKDDKSGRRYRLVPRPDGAPTFVE